MHSLGVGLITRCPVCRQPDGFHAEHCGRFDTPADWRLEHTTIDGDLIRAGFSDSQGAEHVVSVLREHRVQTANGPVAVPLPAWANYVLCESGQGI